MLMSVLPAALLFIAGQVATPAAGPPREIHPVADALDPDAMRKLSPDGKLLLSQPGALEGSGEVSALLRGRGPIGEPERAELERRGAKIRTIAGNVASVTAALASLPHILAFDFVTAVEISRPLVPE